MFCGVHRSSWMLVSFLVILSNFAFAHEWGLQTRVSVITPDNAPGLIVGVLDTRIAHAEPSELSNQRVKLSLKIMDHKATEIGTWNYDLDASDEQCLRRGEDRCQLSKMIFPVAALHYACRGYLTLKQGTRVLGHEERFVLPHCGREFLNNSTADLAAPSLVDAQQLRASISVNGRTSITKNFPVSALILDQTGNILWSARELVQEAILPGTPVEISFTSVMSEKVRKLGCKIVLSTNGSGAIAESDLANNDAVYEWGECIQIDEENLDVIPTHTLVERSLKFGAKNIGDVDVEMPSVLFRTHASDGRILENLQFRLPGNELEGFGDESLLERALPDNVCTVVLEVDPNWVIANEIRTNNQITIKLCP